MGELILVITDGAPSNEEAVVDVIVAATHRMDRDEELGVSFLQIGRDQGASAFLKRLDDDLVGPRKTGLLQRIFGGGKRTARFDICDTLTFADMEDRSLTDVLLSALND